MSQNDKVLVSVNRTGRCLWDLGNISREGFQNPGTKDFIMTVNRDPYPRSDQPKPGGTTHHHNGWWDQETVPLRAAVLGYSTWLHCFQAPGQCFDKVLPWPTCTNLVWATCFIPIVNVLETEHREDYMMRNWRVCLPCFYNSQMPESSRKEKEI